MYRKPLNIDTCPKPHELEAYAARQLIGKRNEEVFHHLKHCGKCLRRMAALTRPTTPESIIHGGRRKGLWQRLKAWRPFRHR